MRSMTELAGEECICRSDPTTKWERLEEEEYLYPVQCLFLPLLQVFDVVLNREHVVVEGLDIYGKVGRGIAHDEIIPFSVKSSKLRVGGESSFLDGRLPIDFVKVRNIPLHKHVFLGRSTVSSQHYQSRITIIQCLQFNSNSDKGKIVHSNSDCSTEFLR